MTGDWLRDRGYEVTPGACVFCGAEILSRTKPAIHCWSLGCLQQYEREYHRAIGRVRTALVPVVDSVCLGKGMYRRTLQCGHVVTVLNPRRTAKARCSECANSGTKIRGKVAAILAEEAQ